MRYEEGHKDITRQSILDVASQLFREQGIVAVGIASIMKEAGLTNGAFYAHFKSKDDLVKNVLIDVLDKRSAWYAEQVAKGMTAEEFIKSYLSERHRDNAGEGCLSAALVSELIQHSTKIKNVYTTKIEETLAQIAELLPGKGAARESKAMAIFSTLIGTLQLARAMTDKDLSNRLLMSGQSAALAILRS